MSLNIIIKGNPPKWRKNQPVLTKFQSLHKDPNGIRSDMAVEKQFSTAELMKIANAVRHTETMGDVGMFDEDDSQTPPSMPDLLLKEKK